MKKIITTLLIAAMLTGMLAGCGGENPENSGAVSDTGNSTSSAESSASSNDSGASSGESSTSSAVSGASSNESGTSSGDGSSVEEGKSPIERLNAVFSQFEMFSKPGESMLMEVGGPDKDAIRAVFPEFEDPEKPTHCVMIVEDGALVAGVIGLTQLDLNDCEDYVVAGPMISAQLKHFVIAKPKAGKEEAVKKALSEYAEVSKNPPADGWLGYPGWEVERAGTYFGETDDGCYYVVVAVEGAEMGSAIENA